MDTTTETHATTAPALADAGDHHDDVAAIRAVIADVELGVNTNDVRPAVRHFAADAVVINAAGALVRGRDAIERAHVAAFTGFLRDQHARYDVGPITFVHPDVAVVTKEARAADADANLLEPDAGPAMRGVYMLVRRDGRWWIAARGNTLVPG